MAVELETASPLPGVVSWVRNTSRHGSRGIFHVVSAAAKDPGRGEAKSRCGWRYDRVSTAVADCAPPPPGGILPGVQALRPECSQGAFASFAAHPGPERPGGVDLGGSPL